MKKGRLAGEIDTNNFCYNEICAKGALLYGDRYRSPGCGDQPRFASFSPKPARSFFSRELSFARPGYAGVFSPPRIPRVRSRRPADSPGIEKAAGSLFGGRTAGCPNTPPESARTGGDHGKMVARIDPGG